MSTLTLEMPDEAEEITDLQEQLNWFVEEQARIHQWRKRRYSSAVDEIVEGAALATWTSMRVQCSSGGTRRFNPPVLKQIYGAR